MASLVMAAIRRLEIAFRCSARLILVIKSEKDLDLILDAPSMVEDMVDIEVEIAVVVARNENGEVKAFPPVAMEFNPVANLVEFLVCPAGLDEKIAREAEELAIKTINAVWRM